MQSVRCYWAGLRHTRWARNCEPPDLGVAIWPQAEDRSFRREASRMRGSGSKSFQLLQAVSAAKRVSHQRGEIPAVWGRGGSRKNQGAFVGSDSPGQSLSARGYAAAAAHVPGTRSVTDHIFSARRAALDVREL